MLAGLLVGASAIAHAALAGEVDDGVTVEELIVIDSVCTAGLSTPSEGPLRRCVLEDAGVGVAVQLLAGRESQYGGSQLRLGDSASGTSSESKKMQGPELMSLHGLPVPPLRHSRRRGHGHHD